MTDSTEPRHALVEVGRYARLAAARERGTVIAACDLPHWIDREGEEWVLRVEQPARERAERELAAFEQEEKARPAPAPEPPAERVETLSLYVAGWLMSAFFLVQNLAGERWMERGVALSDAIVQRGEWWRTFTALTLHGDLAHVAVNIAIGLLFAGFALRHFGTGFTWLGIVLSGALGNLINAWGYRGEAHGSIGASTAVFGALGLLMAGELVARLASPHTRSRWQLVLPVGAGLAFLAFLGVGEEHGNIDIMAHLWGLVAGVPLGMAAAAGRVKERTSPRVQRVAAVVAAGLLAAAWLRAWR
jgi:membrane associated rhomboid family serine protease